jgi:hypothetical protein
VSLFLRGHHNGLLFLLTKLEPKINWPSEFKARTGVQFLAPKQQNEQSFDESCGSDLFFDQH